MTAIRVTACSSAARPRHGHRSGDRPWLKRPARDAAKAVPAGTATLDGIVVSDDADARPLRRVRVARHDVGSAGRPHDGDRR